MKLPTSIIGVVAVLAAAVCFPAGAQDAFDPGVTLRVYRVESPPERIPRIASGQTPNFDELRPAIDFAGDGFGGTEPPFVSIVTGELLVERGGGHVFRLTSDDGSRLLIGRALVVDHDGRHSATTRESAEVVLEAGAHPFRIEHFDHVGNRALRLEWKRPGADSFEVVAAPFVRTERDLTRVTSPGFKRVEDGRRAGDGSPLTGVHPGWTLSTIRPEGFEPKVGAMTFLPDGRLIIGTFDPLQRDDRELPDIDSKPPDVLLEIEHWDAADPAAIRVREVATGLYEPTGMCVVDGDLYVAHRRAVERLTDADGDGYFETHEIVGEGWEGWNYHQFSFGLVHRKGKLYTALSTAMAPPGWEGMETNSGSNGPMRGGLIEIDLETGDTRVVAGGFRTPNGLGLLPDGTMIYLDNQGTWMPTSQLAEVIPGRFYGHYNWTRFVPWLADRFPDGGHPSVHADRVRTPAAVFLPQNEVVNSPTEPVVIEGGPYAGQVLVGELTAGGIRRVALERVNGQLQGALFRFTQGLESGVNRMAWAPDGSLVVGGIGAGGNWNWEGTQFGLQRLTPNGARVFEMLAVRATPTGFEIEFTEPVERAWLARPVNYLVRSWAYEPTAAYGGPKIDERAHEVVRAVPSDDGRRVRIEVAGLQTGRCYHLRTDPVSESGEAIWSTEAWYTLNAIPRAQEPARSSIAGKAIEPGAVGVGVLPPAGAVTMIGAGSSAVMRYDGKAFPPKALSQDDLMELGRGLGEGMAVGFGSGDLVSTTSFGDARIHLEWLSPPGGAGQMAGNSGVYLHERYEIQVLGTPAGDPERAPAINEAGAIYGIKAADRNASAGPGQWQAYDIWFRSPRFLDGEKVADARLTVYWNGVLIHDDVAVPAPTGASVARGEQAHEGVDFQIGPLRLQDHASAAEGPVRYRNVWIKPLEERGEVRAGAWRNLFDETMHWVVRGGEAAFDLRDGELVGTTAPDTPNTFFVPRTAFGDFELIYEARVDPRLNSGVQIRSEVIGAFENRAGGLKGYQIELDPSDRAYSGGIYDERGRGWLHPLHASASARRAFRRGEWNEFRVVAVGPVIRTWINGVPAAEVFDAARGRGRIGFQVHGVGGLADPLEVRFRGVRVRELSAD